LKAQVPSLSSRGSDPFPRSDPRVVAAYPVGAEEQDMTGKPKGRPAQGTTRVIAIANQKGGVGKSTTAVSLGAALAELGDAVLVVDLDPQGNASTGLGIRHDAREVTIYEVLATDASVEDAIVETSVPHLHAVPSTIDLAGAEIELVSLFSREMRLARALQPILDGRYQFVLLDCPPSLGLLTVNALAAARELIVPIQCEYYALEGLGQLLKNVKLVQQNLNASLRLTGIVMTMFDSRTKLAEQVVEEVRKHFGRDVYDTVIPRTVRLSEAPGYGEPITVYDGKSRGAESYRALAAEVLSRPIPKDAGRAGLADLPATVRGVRPAKKSAGTKDGPPSGSREKVREARERAAKERRGEVRRATRRRAPHEDEVSGRKSDVAPQGVESGRVEAPAAEPKANAASVEAQVFGELAEPERGAEPMSETERAEGDYAAEEPTAGGVADLREVEGIGPPPQTSDEDEEPSRKRKWRLFRKGGEA